MERRTGEGTVRDGLSAVDHRPAVRIPSVPTLRVTPITAEQSTLSCDSVTGPRDTAITSLVYRVRAKSVLGRVNLGEDGRTGAEGVGDVLAIVDDAAAVHVPGVSRLRITAVTRLEVREVATLAVSCNCGPGLGDTTISSLVCKQGTTLE